MKNTIINNKIEEIEDPLILKENIKRINTTINKIFNTILGCGSIAFLFTGAQSYFNSNLFFQNNSTYIVFYPQGLTMSIYGIFGIIITINQILNEYYRVGEGYNEFNKKNGEIKIYRKRNTNNDIYIKYKISDIVRKKNVKLKIYL
jgi:hypothetical protein